ncbi:MAG: hypothetical protein PHS92_03720 [Candidatus Gracilibacteria bacterium]|nr:hypothetical protein [Candidatus Gracilibacteria bacterium]
MKTIINGKLYDTDTAEHIGGFYKGGTSKSDFNYVEQDIYRTKNGQLFLYSWGGANTGYATHYGNSRSEGESIELLTIEGLSEWLEENSNYLGESKMNNFLSIIPFPEG